MTQDPEPVDRVAEPRKPYQFTVRTFFAAAVWLGLLMAAVTTLKEEGALGTAVLFLVWIAFAELYRRFRATRALVALGSGPVVLLALWSVLLIATGNFPRRVLPPGPWFLEFALRWGITLSVVVIIERGIVRWVIGPMVRCRHFRASEATRGLRQLPSSGRLRCAASLFAIHTALALVALVISRGMGMVGTYTGTVLMWITDLPLLPLYVLIPGYDPPEMPHLAPASLVLGGALYAAMGWLVSYLAAQFEPRARAVGPPEGTSGDVSPTPDGRDA